MNKRRIFVVEDEPFIREDLVATLKELNYQVEGEATSAEEALLRISENETDLVLLDISIEGAQDGVDLAHQLNNRFSIPFVFITAFYDERTLERARATNPAGYIVKPWDENNLKANIEVALAKREKDHQKVQLSEEPFFVKHGGAMISVKPQEILYAESYDNYTFIYTHDQKFLVSQTLKSIEEKLKPSGFARVHKSWLINILKIDSISEGRVYIQSKHIPLGRAFKANLLNQIQLL